MAQFSVKIMRLTGSVLSENQHPTGSKTAARYLMGPGPIEDEI